MVNQTLRNLPVVIGASSSYTTFIFFRAIAPTKLTDIFDTAQANKVIDCFSSIMVAEQKSILVFPKLEQSASMYLE